MCGNFGTYEDVTPVVVVGGKTRWIDSCIAPLVSALNEAGIETFVSCCGHGLDDGSIMLADGRELVVMCAVLNERGSYETRRADGSRLPSVRPGFHGTEWHPPMLGCPGDDTEMVPLKTDLAKSF